MTLDGTLIAPSPKPLRENPLLLRLRLRLLLLILEDGILKDGIPIPPNPPSDLASINFPLARCFFPTLSLLMKPFPFAVLQTLRFPAFLHLLLPTLNLLASVLPNDFLRLTFAPPKKFPIPKSGSPPFI